MYQTPFEHFWDVDKDLHHIWHPQCSELLIIKGNLSESSYYSFYSLKELCTAIHLPITNYMREVQIIRTQLPAFNDLFNPKLRPLADEFYVYGLVEPNGDQYLGTRVKLHFLGDRLELEPDVVTLTQTIQESERLLRRLVDKQRWGLNKNG